MQKGKIIEKLEIEADQLEWLNRMAKSYSLPDASKALRVVLDHAMEDADEDQVFMSIRCRRCG
jgi:aspartyl/asparaginyl-tRNA synthetase